MFSQKNKHERGDKTYIGDCQITTPQKKQENGELTSSQKEEKKKLSSQRIFVKHMIRLVKVFQVGRDRFRLRVARYQSIILTLCGLVRLRLGQPNLVSLKGRDRCFASVRGAQSNLRFADASR